MDPHLPRQAGSVPQVRMGRKGWCPQTRPLPEELLPQPVSELLMCSLATSLWEIPVGSTSRYSDLAAPG